MAVSYAGGFTAPSQTLPSFRELLPPHLHDEIEATFSSASQNRDSRERPASSGRELALDQRPYSSGPGYAPSPGAPLAEAPRGYPATPARAHETEPMMIGDYRSQQTVHENRPSPFLPPIRDLQSTPERPLNPFGDAVGASRPDRPPAQRVPAGCFPAANDGQRLGGYIGGNGAPVMHGQPPYTYPAVVYHSDSESQSSQIPPHGRQSTFGVMGDPVDSKNKRRRGNLPKPVTDVLRAWFHEHLDHPYPSEEDKQMFMTRTGLSISQISNWFINARRRQLPALRNQMRSEGMGADSQQQPALSDEDTESMPSPRRLPPTDP